MRYKIYRIDGEFGSFEDVDPPRTHEEDLSLWMDWTNAREDWCEDFARITRESYRSADPDPNHLLVLSDQDYHMHTNINHYGVNYTRLMKHFDRFEIYMAAKHDMVEREDLLSDVEFDVKLGLDLACGKPFQFHTWFNEPVDYKPMKPELLEAVIEQAAESGAQVIEVYVFKVRDWRITKGKKMADNQPPFREISLKYQPKMLKSIRKVKERLR